jgi:hypothetical protein
MFSQSFTELAKQKNFYVGVVFSEKSGKMYILPSTTFVAFKGRGGGVSRLCCFLRTAVYNVVCDTMAGPFLQIKRDPQQQ